MSILYQALSRAARDHARRSGDAPADVAVGQDAVPEPEEARPHAGPRLGNFTSISLSRRRSSGGAGGRRGLVALAAVAALLAGGWLFLSSLTSGQGSLLDIAAEIPGVAELAAAVGLAPERPAFEPVQPQTIADSGPVDAMDETAEAPAQDDAMLTPPEALASSPAAGGGIEFDGGEAVAAADTPLPDEPSDLEALAEAEAEAAVAIAADQPATLLPEATDQPVDAPAAAARETLEETLQRLAAERGFTDLAPPVEIVRDGGGSADLDVAVAVPQPGSADFQITVDDRGRQQQASFEAAYASLLAGNTEGALNLYLDVLKDDPGNSFALFGLASTLQRIGWLAEARATYEELLAIEPNNRGALANMMTLISQESPDQALSNLQRLYEINPGFSPIPAQMAVLFAERGNYQEAIRFLKLASDLSPENVMYVYNLAIIYDRLGDVVEARKRYEQVLAAAEVRDVSVPLDAVRQRVSYLKRL